MITVESGEAGKIDVRLYFMEEQILVKASKVVWAVCLKVRTSPKFSGECVLKFYSHTFLRGLFLSLCFCVYFKSFTSLDFLEQTAAFHVHFSL